jgi:hypothetical protein
MVRSLPYPKICGYKVYTLKNLQIVKVVFPFFRKQDEEIWIPKKENILRRFPFYLNTKGQTFLSDVFIWHILQMTAEK